MISTMPHKMTKNFEIVYNFFEDLELEMNFCYK